MVISRALIERFRHDFESVLRGGVKSDAGDRLTF